MNGATALERIKQHGIFGLCESDGCACAHFSVHGVSVDISCRKSSGAKPEGFWGTLIRVWSHHIDSTPDELVPIGQYLANEMCSSIKVPTLIRFCDYDQDKDCKCVYCGEPRGDYDNYLCDACKTRKDGWGDLIAPQYSFPRILLEPSYDD